MSRKPSFRTFISAVSGELASYREEVARVLRRTGLEVCDEKHFRQGAATLLEQLRDYIRDCDAVILLIGNRCGAFPGVEHAAALGSIPEFDEFQKATGSAEASYTQWEFILARHFGKDNYTFFTADKFEPDNPSADSSDLHELQQKYREWIEKTGKHRDSFTTVAKLIEDVLVLPFPDLHQPKPISLPYPSLGALFKGRDEFLTDLRASLSDDVQNQATAIVGKAVHGLGGVGKTRLAVEYAWQYADDYTALLFVTADSPANLRRNLAALAGPLILNLPEESAQEEDVKVAAAFRWLHDHPGWFLILDNVDTEQAALAVEELLARLAGGQFLITSRLARWSGAVEPFELDVLSPNAAMQLVLDRTDNRRRKRDTDLADATEISRELGGLALALEQAGAYIAHRRISLADYLAAWRTHSPTVQDWHDPRTMKYPRSIAVTWQTTLDQLGPAELALLRLFAWFAPDPIPLFILEQDEAEAIWRDAIALLADNVPAAIPPGTGGAADTLAMLADFNLIRWDPSAETVSVHRVLKEILRNQIPAQQRSAWLTCSLHWINAVSTGDPSDVRTWPRWDALRPHVAAVVAHADQAGIAKPVARLMNDLGMLLLQKANYADAERLLRRSLAIADQPPGSDNPDVAPILNNFGSLLQKTNRLAEAEPLLRRALAIDEQAYGPDHPNVARDLNNFAWLLKESNRLAQAEPLLRRALAIDEQLYGPNHPDVAIDLSNLGALLKEMKRLSEAEPLLRRALAIDEHSYGSDHPQIARDLGRLATVLQKTNRLADAEPLKRRALAIVEKSYGPDHPKVAHRLGTLASLLQESDRLAEAERLKRRALEINEQAFGPVHPEVAIDLASLASLLHVSNRLAEAEPLMRRAMEIYRDFVQKTGHTHLRMPLTLEKYKLLLRSLKLSEEEITERLQQVVR